MKPKVDLESIMKLMPRSVVLRASPIFPDYAPGTDVDILCQDLDACVEFISSHMDVRKTIVSPVQVHLDYFVDGELDIKFDLYGEYMSWEFTQGLLNATIDRPLVAPEFYDNIAKCYEFFINKKEKYKSYDKYLPLLDEYYFY